YDCRYCFLQGIYRSANYVLFVNYRDFITQIRERCESANHGEIHFFSGYDCDSLALDPLTRFVEHFLPVFRDYPHALLELRTKSTQIRSLLELSVQENVVIAFSFTPEKISGALEHKVPDVQRRLAAIKALQEKGWHIGLRFDPLIYSNDFKHQYPGLFSTLLDEIDHDKLHSVSLGSFRLPTGFFKTMQHLYPDEKLFAAGLRKHNGMVSYRTEIQDDLIEYSTTELLKYIPREKFYSCSVAS
ncbi:MAG: hypothetical protein MI673_08700, partial [Thiotrichales bacterium]|nr:hypothetical protein [Thiotrichales bacterium]